MWVQVRKKAKKKKGKNKPKKIKNASHRAKQWRPSPSVTNFVELQLEENEVKRTSSTRSVNEESSRIQFVLMKQTIVKMDYMAGLWRTQNKELESSIAINKQTVEVKTQVTITHWITVISIGLHNKAATASGIEAPKGRSGSMWPKQVNGLYVDRNGTEARLNLLLSWLTLFS